MSGFALRLMSVVALSSLTVGCAVARVQQPEADTLATWSEHPLPPDAALAARAVSEQSSCPAEDKDRPIRVLIQDRRTQQSAAFLFAGRTVFGSCFITTGGGATSGGSGPLPGARTIPLVIDENGNGNLGSGAVRLLGGRVADGAAQVIVELADGRSVFASVGSGYWLAWWPDTSKANRVVAKDASGAEISTVGVVG